MKDPVRLLDGAASQVERALLRAGAGEEPPADGARRLAAALGLPATISTPPQPIGGTGSAAGASEGAAASGAASGTTAASGLVLKWLVIAGAGAAIAAAVAVLRAPATPPEPRPTPGVDPGRATTQLPGEGSAAPAAPAATEPQPASANGEPAAAAPAQARSIAREIEQLDGVRAHLQRGRARAALSLLEAYRRAHPGGVLAQEAALLQVEALAGAGERTEARRQAERFLREHPGSPHAARVRVLLGEADAR